jgi:hypothetical protein
LNKKNSSNNKIINRANILGRPKKRKEKKEKIECAIISTDPE